MNIRKRLWHWQHQRALVRYMRIWGRYNCGRALAEQMSSSLYRTRLRIEELEAKL